MKTFARTVILFAIFFISVQTINAQVEFVLKNSIPELYGDLKITDEKEYDKSLKDVYRALYFKLDSAYGDVKAYELGAADPNTMQVLDYRDIKKIDRNDKLDSLKIVIDNYKTQINDFMKWHERFAADSVNVALYYTGFKDNLTAKNYDKAYKNWKKLFNNYPLISSSVYRGGSILVKRKIKNAKDSATREAYIDTLFMVYDQEIKVYPKREYYVKGKKAVDYHNLYIKDQDLNDSIIREKMYINYKMCMDAIETGGEKTRYYVFPITMKLTVFENMLDSISDEQAINNYIRFSEILDKQYKEEDDPKKKERIKKGGIAPTDMIFTKSDLSTCDNLCDVFQDKFENDPENPDNLKKIMSILAQKECTDRQLYTDVAEALYQIEPSASSARALALLYASKDKYEKAQTYFEAAIEQETVDTIKGIYYFEAAKNYKQQNKYSKAREYARKAVELNPNDGNPYILIAIMYAETAGSVGDNQFAHNAVFWAAVDKLQQAKNIDPSCTETANDLIGNYSSQYPDKEEGFMRGVHQGDSYTVGGWIGETTTVRYH